MAAPHALLVPFPAQGHILSLMELARRLTAVGFEVTFVNTEHNHRRLLAAGACRVNGVRMVAVPDGLAAADDRLDLGMLIPAVVRVMPGHLEQLILQAKAAGGEPTCLVADMGLGWAFDIAKKMGLRAAAFWAASATTLSTIMSIPKLIEDGIIHSDGRPAGKETFQLSAGMPVQSLTHLSWSLISDPVAQLALFRLLEDNNRAIAASEAILICNSFAAIEAATLAYLTRVIPLGPLLSDRRFWPEDDGGAAWLDKQPPRSVIYAAFGSTAVFRRRQLQELEHGLELSGRPFLWVMQAGGDNPPEIRRQRLLGKVVEWAPQQQVLAHPAVACFLTHCGWNSTVEGAANGVPLLCLPYFADQFLNCDYICDVWRTGMRLEADGEGIVSGEEIRKKLEKLLADEGVKERAQKIKEEAERTTKEGGNSNKNFHTFALAMQGKLDVETSPTPI